MKASRLRRLQRYVNKQRNAAKRQPLLTRDQERDLLGRAAEGDVWAGQLLVLHSLRYVLWVASRYVRLIRDEGEFDDLVQEGCLGLAEALADYKADQESKTNDAPFIAYAKWQVKNNIFRTLRDAHQTIYLPPDLHKALRRCAKGERVADVSNRRIRAGRRVLRTLRYDHRDFDRMIARYADHIEVANIRLDRRSLGLWLYDLLERLHARDAAILVLRFGLGGKPPKTLAQVGKVIKLTPERVRYLEWRAIDRLHAQIRRLPRRERRKLIDIDCDISN